MIYCIFPLSLHWEVVFVFCLLRQSHKLCLHKLLVEMFFEQVLFDFEQGYGLLEKCGDLCELLVDT